MEFASGYTTIIFKEKKNKNKKTKKRNKKNPQIWISLIDCEYNFSNLLLLLIFKCKSINVFQ